MIIYRILNTLNKKCYIGQTKFETFKDRYWGKWYKSTHSRLLKNAVKKYRENNFAIQILESNIQSFDELDKLEAFYIKKYDSIYPNGYNWNSGGKANHILHKLTKRKIGNKNSKIYKFINLKGEIYRVKNLKNFCKKNGLSYPPMKNMAAGKHISSQGYALFETPILLIKNPNKIYTLKNITTNETVSFPNIKKFCKEHNLEPTNIQRLLRNQRISPYHDWITPEMNLSRFIEEKRYFGKKLISPIGEIFTLKESPYSFAKKHPPLDRKDVYMLVDKKTDSRKGGWKLYE